jgi:hypothetical protein
MRRLASRGIFGLGARFYIKELRGDCPAPSITDRYAIVDRLPWAADAFRAPAIE